MGRTEYAEVRIRATGEVILMQSRKLICIIGSCVCVAAMLSFAPHASADSLSVGPDVVVGGVGYGGDVAVWGPSGGKIAYTFRTDACNYGDEPVDWIANTNEHPAICQNMFRLKEGRFEQIGQAWMKHGFCAVNYELCGPGCVATGCESLGVGCSDPYVAALNGQQSIMGPKSLVNASTGVFPYPSPGGAIQTSLDRRLQVEFTDIDPAQNPGAQYFLEGHYVSPDDAVAGNAKNNATWRDCSIGVTDYRPSPFGGPRRTEPAIFAWQEYDPEVVISEVEIPNDGAPGYSGWFWVAAKATDNGDGTWHYEYAIQNLNSDRAARAVRVQTQRCPRVTNVGFHDVFYHSGEQVDGDDWTVTIEPNAVVWETEAYLTNFDANALRWGTLYNFRFDANAPPVFDGILELELWKPGTPASVEVTTITPAPTCQCLGNLACDDYVNGDDIALWLAMALGETDVDECADVAPPFDGILDSDDLAEFVARLLTTPLCTVPTLLYSEPDNDETIWRTQNNILRLYFDVELPDIPAPGDLKIQMLLGGLGPDLSADFSFSIEEDGQGRSRILRIQEDGTVLSERTWYRIRNDGTWTDVNPFSFDVAVQVGDVNNDGVVSNADVNAISAVVPMYGAADDDRRDIDGDGDVLNADFLLADERNPAGLVPKFGGG